MILVSYEFKFNCWFPLKYAYTPSNIITLLRNAIDIYPENPSEDDKTGMKLFLKNICVNQPNSCAIFFRDYFIENNIEDVVSTKQTIKQLYEKINKSFSQ